MKKVYVALVLTLLVGASCPASSISAGPQCPGPKCTLQPTQTVTSSSLLSSTTSSLSSTSLSLTSLTPILSSASNLLLQNSAPLGSSSTTSTPSLSTNTVVSDVTAKTKGASPTAEPSSLLILSVGLLFLALFRKRRRKGALHLRPA